MPVSPFLTKRHRELSETLKGMDTDGEESSNKALNPGRLLPAMKAKMGWYKVPRMSYDYGPATIDTILADRGVKEPEEHKITTAVAI